MPGIARRETLPAHDEFFRLIVQGIPKPAACFRNAVVIIYRENEALMKALTNGVNAILKETVSSPAA
jgi:hypothetical protein